MGSPGQAESTDFRLAAKPLALIKKRIMKFFLTILTITMALVSFGQDFEFNYNNDYNKILSQTNDSSSNLFYDKLLNRFNKNDTTLSDYEVLCLLIGYTDNIYFKPYNYLKTEREIYDLNDEGKYNIVIVKCDSFLNFVPVSQQALIEKSFAFHKLGKKDSADFYSWKFQKIMWAMYRSGNGLTPETAFFSLGPADGQNFITKFFRSEIGIMGSGHDKNGNFVDILEIIVKDEKTGEVNKKKLYFQIEHAVKKMFSPEEFKQLEDD